MNYCTASVYMPYKRIPVKRIGYLEEEGGAEKKSRKMSLGGTEHPVGKVTLPPPHFIPEVLLKPWTCR